MKRSSRRYNLSCDTRTTYGDAMFKMVPKA